MNKQHYLTQGPRFRIEDAYHIEETETAIYVAIADGMGGHPNGDKAAALAIDLISKEIKNSDQCFEAVFQEIDSILGQFFDRRGTTLILVVIDKLTNQVSWISVGDSYIFDIDTYCKRVNPLDEYANGALSQCLGGGYGGGLNTVRKGVFELKTGILLISDGAYSESLQTNEFIYDSEFCMKLCLTQSQQNKDNATAILITRS